MHVLIFSISAFSKQSREVRVLLPAFHSHNLVLFLNLDVVLSACLSKTDLN